MGRVYGPLFKILKKLVEETTLNCQFFQEIHQFFFETFKNSEAEVMFFLKFFRTWNQSFADSEKLQKPGTRGSLVLKNFEKPSSGGYKSISICAQYVTLDNKIKCLSLASSFFGNPTQKTGTAYMWLLLVANQLDQSFLNLFKCKYDSYNSL
jgi:hypothetical protein